jgi:hypothetical protein
MHSSKLLKALIRGSALTCVLLLFILVGFQGLPIFTGSDVQSVNQAGLQRERSQSMAKAALLVEYVPSERAASLSDLQVVLPLFIAEQQTLLKNTQPEVQSSLQDARPNYLAFVAAVTVIINDPASETLPDQVLTIQAVNKPYLTAMNKLVFLLQSQSDARVLQLFIIEVIIDVLFFLIVILASMFSDRLTRQIVQEGIKQGRVKQGLVKQEVVKEE